MARMMSRLLRNALLVGSGLGVAAFVYGRFVERARVRLDRYTVEIDGPGIPRRGFTILHLSDLHIRSRERVQDRKLARLRALLAGEQYDILAFTGDLIHHIEGLDAAIAFLRGLTPRLGAFTVPGNRDYVESSFLAVLGTREERAKLPLAARLRMAPERSKKIARRFLLNEPNTLKMRTNDMTAINDRLAAAGMRPLMNTAHHLQVGDVDLWLAGVDDLGNGRPDLRRALAPVPEAATLILLAHNPDAWLHPLANRADLILSGHTHGGQVAAPVFGALYRQGTHLDRRTAAGWFVRGRTRLFVSRGLGESFPLRIGSPLQAVLITLVPKDT
jgi:predicted MPP superfamily phosphohydrolase